MSDERPPNPGPGPDPIDERPLVSRGGVAQFRPKTGGRLNRGGTPGHDGSNAGTTPRVIREELRKMFMRNIKKLEKIAKDPKASPATKMKAMEMMLKYGSGTPSSTLNGEGEVIEPTLTIVERDERASTADDNNELDDGDVVPELPPG